MTSLYLKNKNDGHIHVFTDELAKRADMEPYTMPGASKPTAMTPELPIEEAKADVESDWRTITDKLDLAGFALTKHKVVLDTDRGIANMRAQLVAALQADQNGASAQEAADEQALTADSELHERAPKKKAK